MQESCGWSIRDIPVVHRDLCIGTCHAPTAAVGVDGSQLWVDRGVGVNNESVYHMQVSTACYSRVHDTACRVGSESEVARLLWSIIDAVLASPSASALPQTALCLVCDVRCLFVVHTRRPAVPLQGLSASLCSPSSSSHHIIIHHMQVGAVDEVDEPSGLGCEVAAHCTSTGGLVSYSMRLVACSPVKLFLPTVLSIPYNVSFAIPPPSLLLPRIS